MVPGVTWSSGTVRSPLSVRMVAVRGVAPISALIEARARSVLRSAMYSAIRMIVISTAPATYSPPSTAMTVATVTNNSVPIFRSVQRSWRPVFARGYSPIAIVISSTGIGTTPSQ